MAYALRDYLQMLVRLRERGYCLARVRDYFCPPSPHRAATIYLKHDVDRWPARAVQMAHAEAAIAAPATYYFRCDSCGQFPSAAIRSVLELGHEIGFHYECLSRERGVVAAALARFGRELSSLRAIGPVATIAAHGAPLSAVSNMDFARGLNLKRLALLGDAILGVDFRSVLYITDSGGVYGSRSNRRDWSPGLNLREPTPPRALAEQLDPLRQPLAMISSHPERWPQSRLGVIQATTGDAIVNGLKRWAEWRDARRATFRTCEPLPG